MIKVENVIKSFDDNLVLKGVSTDFIAGKTNLIIGQSGSGKTVLLKCLVGLMRPDSGRILYGDRNLLDLSSKDLKNLRTEIGMLFQGSALFDSMTVLENVLFPLTMFTTNSRSENYRRAMFCLERVNLTHAEKLFPSEISGGMQKRVAIARAISLNPRYLFCDEPNSGLDPKTSIVIDELISDITKEYNITTVINTHDMNSVMGIGENITFINKGEVAWIGNKDQILTTNNKTVNDFVFASNLFQKVRDIAVNAAGEEA
ncbi:MAG: ABC transporter ATP-binding protein [Bacteroidales bacterium]